MPRPDHIALIPDGNRRWARANGRAAWLGHDAGAAKTEAILERALEAGIPYVTVWGSSQDNMVKRSKEEVAMLFKVFETYFTKLSNSKVLADRDVRVVFIGRWREQFPRNLTDIFDALMEKTAAHTKHRLTFLMAYSGVDEMTDTIARLAAERPSAVDSEAIRDHLWTRDLPPLDLIIRTGGEPHWSAGFMMWHAADAELYFTETLWPDFGPEELGRALASYEKTARRFGA